MKDCVSLEVAQKLQKAGYKCECAYSWGHIDKKYWECRNDWGAELVSFEPENSIPAPTATQLAEELPKDVHFFCGIKIKKRRTHAQHIHIFHGNGWMVNYTGGGARENYTQRGDTLPDALGLMMVYLLENKLI